VVGWQIEAEMGYFQLCFPVLEGLALAAGCAPQHLSSSAFSVGKGRQKHKQIRQGLVDRHSRVGNKQTSRSRGAVPAREDLSRVN